MTEPVLIHLTATFEAHNPNDADDADRIADVTAERLGAIGWDVTIIRNWPEDTADYDATEGDDA